MEIQGLEKKLKSTTWKTKKHSFPGRWNRLDAEVINARYIHNFKSKLDNSKFGDGTV